VWGIWRTPRSIALVTFLKKKVVCENEWFSVFSDLNDGEFLKMHFESSVPDKPLKSILKRKCNTSSEIMTAER